MKSIPRNVILLSVGSVCTRARDLSTDFVDHSNARTDLKPKMKSIQLILIFIAVAALVAGCATTATYEHAEKTGVRIAEFREEVVNVKKAVDTSMSLLNQTVESAATDPRKAFEAFAKSVDDVESARAEAGNRAATVKAEGAAYFKKWEVELATINNPEIRKLAEERKAKLNEIFGKIGPLLEQTKNDFDPFLADLKDLRTFLRQDLTVAGVDAAKSIIAKARESGAKVQKSLDDLIAEMNSIAAALTPGKAAPKE